MKQIKTTKNNNELMLFNNEEFGEIRTVTINEKIHFIATDIAKALGYSNPNDAIKKHCRWVAKCEVPHPQSKSKTMQVNAIPEGDMYRLIARSELPSAEKFESWVFDEVLPSIRKNGGYITDSATPEQVRNLVLCHSFKSITKQIVECDVMQLEKTIDEILEVNLKSKKLSRDKYHIDLSKSEYKIKLYEHIRKAIDSRQVEANDKLIVEIAIQKKICDKISKELMSTTRRSTSQIVSNQEKKIQKLESVHDYTNKLIWLDYAPFSINYMYTDQHKITDAYKKWMDEFPYHQLENKESFDKRVDSDNPMRVVFEIVSKQGQDTDNAIKSFQDRLQDFYRFDDINIEDVNIKNVGSVKKYADCKIGYYLENV